MATKYRTSLNPSRSPGIAVEVSQPMVVFSIWLHSIICVWIFLCWKTNFISSILFIYLNMSLYGENMLNICNVKGNSWNLVRFLSHNLFFFPPCFFYIKSKYEFLCNLFMLDRPVMSFYLFRSGYILFEICSNPFGI